MKRSFIAFCLLISAIVVMLWSCGPLGSGNGDNKDSIQPSETTDTLNPKINPDDKVVPPGGEVIKDKGDSL